ncbi:MAG: hypothetical protein HOP28_10600 [Gemmatimonadales bacterium]|nr:hypothetical protein [Gemmatimonadales bacterium]
MTVVPQFSPALRRLPASCCVGIALAGNLLAQAPVRLPQVTPFLREPNGLRLAVLAAGSRITPGRVSNDHIEITVQGWIITSSTRADRRDGFDLSISAAGGENFRAAPDGELLGRAVTGALFNRVSARGGWTQIRRTGWIPRAGLTPRAPAVATRPQPAPPVSTLRESAGAVPRADPDSAERQATLRAGVVVRGAPDGAALATVASATTVTLGVRDREWVKVTIDGWVRQSDVSGLLMPRPAITAAMLRDSPEKYVGQTVDWRLQFLSHQKADELRPEMPLGHPYLLARGPLPETGFVYVLVSKDQAERLQGLKPLDELGVMVTVRSARTRYLATPVVELVRLGPGN